MNIKFDNNVSLVINDTFLNHLQRIFSGKKIKQIIPIKPQIYAVLISSNNKDLWYLVLKEKKRYFYFQKQATTFMELILIYTTSYYLD